MHTENEFGTTYVVQETLGIGETKEYATHGYKKVILL